MEQKEELVKGEEWLVVAEGIKILLVVVKVAPVMVVVEAVDEGAEDNMPVHIRKVNGYRVSHGGKVSAKSTTRAKAHRQANLLRAVAHGWKPTGKKARK